MNCNAITLPYQHTGYFSKIIADYLEDSEFLRPFYQHAVSMDGIKSAIHARQQYDTDRQLLVEQLKKQYESIETGEAVKQNIEKLADNNCFTITTAHQPAIFTGTLFFIYK